MRALDGRSSFADIWLQNSAQKLCHFGTRQIKKMIFDQADIWLTPRKSDTNSAG